MKFGLSEIRILTIVVFWIAKLLTISGVNNMKTIIAGSRDGFTYQDLCLAMDACGFSDKITEVVSGTARGSDLFGEKWAHEHGLPVTRFPAKWEEHGKAAGHIRNAEMAKYADAAVILWDGVSKGTEGMIKISKNFENHYIYMVRFFNAPAPPLRSEYRNTTCFRVAMEIHNAWEKSMADQGIRMR